MRIALARDAWTPQVNGVVTTLKATAASLVSLGHEVRILHPQGLACLPCPSYPSTSRPRALAVRRFCRARGFPVPGPQDVIEPGVTGVLHADLAVAIGAALRLDRRQCAARARVFSWHAASQQFLDGLVPIPLTQRAGLAVSRSSAMIERIAAGSQPSQAGDAN